MATNSTNDLDKYKQRIILRVWGELLDANTGLGRLLNRKPPITEQATFLLKGIIKAAECALEKLEKKP